MNYKELPEPVKFYFDACFHGRNKATTRDEYKRELAGSLPQAKHLNLKSYKLFKALLKALETKSRAKILKGLKTYWDSMKKTFPDEPMLAVMFPD